jgi:uncharacterized membrane protein
VQINFQNGYSSLVYVAIAQYDTNCDPPWASEGWWGIEPGATVHVANTCNRYLLFYAEAVDGTYWAGPYQFQVTESAFFFCPTAEIGYSGATVGMREVDDDIGSICWPWDSYTVELVG